MLRVSNYLIARKLLTISIVPLKELSLPGFVKSQSLLRSKLVARRTVPFLAFSSTKLILNSVSRQKLVKSTPLLLSAIGLMAFLGFGTKKDEEQEDELIMTLKRSILLIENGELKKAEQMLHLALRIAQQKQNAEGITYVYDLLANVALDCGELEKSEKLFVIVMQRLLNAGVAQDDLKIIHMSLKLAEIYSFQFLETKKADLAAKSKEGFRFCYDTLQKKIEAGADDEDTVLLTSLAAEGYSKVLSQEGEMKKARDLMHVALDLSIKSDVDTDERYSTLLGDLGALNSMCGDETSAIKYLNDAIKVGRDADVDNLPAYLVNLGLLNLYKGLKDEATALCKEAWHLSRTKKNKKYEKDASDCLDEIKSL